MLDLVKLTIKAGNGGDGRVSFHRAKSITKGGPDGGDGGDGGNVYLVGRKNHNTLQLYAGKTSFAAEAGAQGGAQKMFGRKGEDLYLEVPVGTVVWELKEESQVGGDTASKEMKPEDFDLVETVSRHTEDLRSIRLKDIEKVKVAEVLEDGQEVLLCKGGKGGRGNEHFKGPANTTPMEHEDGTPGDQKEVLFELKLLADIGLVGFPNAGKSTFLSLITKANPKIGNYPFTTLEANLGVMAGNGQEIVLADIPGIIEGASEGKGLGIQFLRHIERCKALMYVLSLNETVIFDDEMSDVQKAEALWEQYQALQHELHSYDPRLEELQYMVTVNKIDLYSDELQQAIQDFFTKKKTAVILWSGVSRIGLEDVKQKMTVMLQ